jgi:hypothetical protein
MVSGNLGYTGNVVRALLVCVLVVGCYNAHPAFDVPCSSTGACPLGQICVADRCVLEGTIEDALDLDAAVDARLLDAASPLDATPDAMPPAIRWKSTTTATVLQNAPALSVTVAHPACDAADVMVAAIAMGVTGAATNSVFTPPPGWTLVRRSDHGNDTALVVYWHAAGAAEPATYTWQFSTMIHGVAWISCYGNVDPIAPIDVEQGGVIATTGPSYAAPSITPTRASTMLVLTCVSHAPTSAGTTWMPPVQTSQRVNLNNGTTRSGTSADRLLSTTNPTGATLAIASEAQDYALVESLALRPAP